MTINALLVVSRWFANGWSFAYHPELATRSHAVVERVQSHLCYSNIGIDIPVEPFEGGYLVCVVRRDENCLDNKAATRHPSIAVIAFIHQPLRGFEIDEIRRNLSAFDVPKVDGANTNLSLSISFDEAKVRETPKSDSSKTREAGQSKRPGEPQNSRYLEDPQKQTDAHISVLRKRVFDLTAANKDLTAASKDLTVASKDLTVANKGLTVANKDLTAAKKRLTSVNEVLSENNKRLNDVIWISRIALAISAITLFSLIIWPRLEIRILGIAIVIGLGAISCWIYLEIHQLRINKDQ